MAKTVHDAKDRAGELKRLRGKVESGLKPSFDELDYILSLAELSEGLRDDSRKAAELLSKAGVGAQACNLQVRLEVLLRGVDRLKALCCEIVANARQGAYEPALFRELAAMIGEEYPE